MFAKLMSSPRFLRAVVWFDASTGVLLGALHLLLPHRWPSGWVCLQGCCRPRA